MENLKLMIPKLDIIRSAQTLDQVRVKINNDQFFRFEKYYINATASFEWNELEIKEKGSYALKEDHMQEPSATH